MCLSGDVLSILFNVQWFLRCANVDHRPDLLRLALSPRWRFSIGTLAKPLNPIDGGFGSGRRCSFDAFVHSEIFNGVVRDGFFTFRGPIPRLRWGLDAWFIAFTRDNAICFIIHEYIQKWYTNKMSSFRFLRCDMRYCRRIIERDLLPFS